MSYLGMKFQTWETGLNILGLSFSEQKSIQIGHEKFWKIHSWWRGTAVTQQKSDDKYGNGKQKVVGLQPSLGILKQNLVAST
jgi:hypothetical protein